jgi:hypothetical protein
VARRRRRKGVEFLMEVSLVVQAPDAPEGVGVALKQELPIFFTLRSACGYGRAIDGDGTSGAGTD